MNEKLVVKVNMTEDTVSKEKTIAKLNHILSNLENNSDFYEDDINYEYTPFEESLKDFCDHDINQLIRDKNSGFAWDCLSKIVEKLYELDDYIDFEEELFRACELLTYYIGRVMYHSTDDMKNTIYIWIYNHIKENEHSQYVDSYLKPFLNGEKINCSDEYYTGYDDYDKMISISE